MSKVFVIGEYLPSDSILHRLDPRTKLIGMVLMLVAVFYPSTWLGAASSLFVVTGIAAAARAGWKIWIQALLRFLWMLLIVFAVNLFSRGEGRPVTALGHELPFTWEGIQTSFLFTVQIALAVTLSMTLTFTTSAREIIKATERIARPLKRLGLPVEEFSMVLLLALRFIPLLQLELQMIIDGQKSRGVEFDSGSMVTRAYNLIAVLVPALTSVLTRADLLATAMLARGFLPGADRSTYYPLVFSKADYIALLTLCLFCLCRLTLFS
jgi:energy-coupling factor transport system permease protein